MIHKTMKSAALIVSAGKGYRFSGEKKKQFLTLAGKPILCHTLEKFETCPSIDLIQLVVGQEDMDYTLKEAVRCGLDPMTAIQMATINPARYFPLPGIGAIAPGYQADLVVIEDLNEFRIGQVFKAGRLVAEKGKILPGVIDERKVKAEKRKGRAR